MTGLAPPLQATRNQARDYLAKAARCRALSAGEVLLLERVLDRVSSRAPCHLQPTWMGLAALSRECGRGRTRTQELRSGLLARGILRQVRPPSRVSLLPGAYCYGVDMTALAVLVEQGVCRVSGTKPHPVNPLHPLRGNLFQINPPP